MSATRIQEFRRRLGARKGTVGTFQKTPNAAVTEVLGMSGLDCVCIDAEHAPFDRAAMDIALLAARAHDLPTLVRVPTAGASGILNALDLGATGVIVPHVTSAETARAIVSACRYGVDGRGYAGSTRAAGYSTRKMTQIIADANETTTVVLQIEDAAALSNMEEIAGVNGVDALFIGRMDLTVSLGAPSPDDPQVVAAVEHICTVARRQERCVGMFTTTMDEALRWRSAGASFFLLGSDQQWILHGAQSLAKAFENA